MYVLQPSWYQSYGYCVKYESYYIKPFKMSHNFLSPLTNGPDYSGVTRAAISTTHHIGW